MPFCDTPAMQQHLMEISATVAADAHAILILDQAGWHLARALVVPTNITILPLPPRSPELNPVENLWQFMRDNWLSNRVFKGYDDIVAHCCAAWRGHAIERDEIYAKRTKVEHYAAANVLSPSKAMVPPLGDAILRTRYSRR